MKKTYAYSGIIVGFLIGILVGLKTENLIIGVVVGLLVSVAAFVVIRVFENMLYKGADKLSDKAQEALMKRNAQKATGNGAPAPRDPAQPLTQFPGRAAAAQRVCPSCGRPGSAEDLFCQSCGSKIDQ